MTCRSDRIEKTVLLDKSRDVAWRVVSEAKHYSAWSGLAVEGEFAVGATVKGRMVGTKFDTAYARMQEPYRDLMVDLSIECVEPGRLLSYRMHPFAVERDTDYSNEPMTLVAFELSDAAGGTLLRITESGFDALVPERRTAAYYACEAGWTRAAKAIETYLLMTS